MLQLGFISITIASFVLFYLGSGRDKRLIWFFCIWTVYIGLLSLSGFLKHTEGFSPRVLLVIVPMILYVIYFYRKLNVDKIKINYLIAIHTLRLPVELTLYQLYMDGKVPILMTYKGWNFDILTGLLAFLILFISLKSKGGISLSLLKVWNVFGLVFLGIILVIAVLSLPSPIQQLAFEQPNVAVLEFPFTYLPAIVVPLVLLSHLLIYKIKK